MCVYIHLCVGKLFHKKGQLVYRSERPVVLPRGLTAGCFMGIFSDDNWNFIPLTLKPPPELP